MRVDVCDPDYSSLLDEVRTLYSEATRDLRMTLASGCVSNGGEKDASQVEDLRQKLKSVLEAYTFCVNRKREECNEASRQLFGRRGEKMKQSLPTSGSGRRDTGCDELPHDRSKTKVMQDLMRSLTEQVKLSELTSVELEKSSQRVLSTRDEFTGIAGLVLRGRMIVSMCRKRRIYDLCIIVVLLTTFIAAVLYVIIKRL